MTALIILPKFSNKKSRSDLRKKKSPVFTLLVISYVNARKKKRAIGTRKSTAAEDWCGEWEDGRERLYRIFAVKSALPFHASFSFPHLGNLPHPRESFRRMKTLLFMRHVQARRRKRDRHGGFGNARIRAFVQAARLVWERIAKLATLCGRR